MSPSSGPPTERSPCPRPPPAPPSQVGENGRAREPRGSGSQGRTVSSWGCEVKARTFLSVGVPRRTRDRRVRWPTTQETSTRCSECRWTCQIWTGADSQRSLWGQKPGGSREGCPEEGAGGGADAAVTLLRGRLGDGSPGVTWTWGAREGCRCELRSQAPWAAGTPNQARGKAVAVLRGRPRPGGQQARAQEPGVHCRGRRTRLSCKMGSATRPLGV